MTTDRLLTFHQAVDDANNLAKQINPQEYDVICGIPRGGLFIANIVACQLGLPLSTPELLQQNIAWQSANVKGLSTPLKICDGDNVLLIDDTLKKGKRFTVAMQYLTKFNVKFAVPYVCKNASFTPDYVGQILHEPTAVQWSLMTWNFGTEKILSDIDGVICKDYIRGMDTLEFMKTTKPLFIPKFTIDTLFTGRPEKYRDITVDWLSKHNVQYNNLVMFPEEYHGTSSQVVDFKCSIVKELNPRWIWESSDFLAKCIHKRTKKTVLCFDTWKLYSSACGV